MDLVQQDKSLIWHPFTQMKTARDAIAIQKAEGCYLYATDGKRYLDAISSWWVNIHGHCHPYIAKKISEQASVLEQVIFAGFTHEPAIKLAASLVKCLPAYSKVFYSDDGSTSVEVALKMALQFWYNRGETGKNKIITLEDAYHGDTFGSMAVGERSLFTAPFQPLLFSVERIPLPTDKNIGQCLEQFSVLLKTGTIAAFIFEPLVLGAAGMKMYQPHHLDALLALAKEHGVLCIADEVMTGFGRTGKNYAIDYLTGKPDIVCLSKGITGGFLPLGATLCTQEIFDAFYADEAAKTLFHGHSYTANPLACAAANASMELFLGEICQQQIQLISSAHNSFLSRLESDDFIIECRQLGTILALEINTGEGSSYFHTIKEDIYTFCLNRGVLLRPLGNIIYCMPPYCIKKEELNFVYEVIIDLIRFLKKK